jgi:ribosomal-protein-alanine N-acetyltransferase
VICIRKIERGDLDQLFALDKICFRHGIAYSKSDLNYFIRHARSLSFAAVDAVQKLVGFAIVESQLESGRRVGHIVTIDVDPQVRRQGVGRLLMQAMLDGLVALGTDFVRLEVAVDNIAAQAFYKKFGFAATGRIHGFYLGRLDAVTMQRGLTPGTGESGAGESGTDNTAG